MKIRIATLIIAAIILFTLSACSQQSPSTTSPPSNGAATATPTPPSSDTITTVPSDTGEPQGDNSLSPQTLTAVEVIPHTYPNIWDDKRAPYADGLLRVQSSNWTSMGLINIHTGKEIVPLGNYAEIGAFYDGMALVMRKEDGNSAYGYIDQTGKEIVPPQYEGAMKFSDGLAAVMIGKKWGYIDTTGNVVLPLEYASASFFIDGAAIVGLSGTAREFNLIDKTGAIVLSLNKYAHTFDASEGMIRVEGKFPNHNAGTGKYGFIDTLGNEIVAPVYESVSDFSGGIARVNKTGIIDKTGTEIVPPGKYKSVGEFSEGLAYVDLDNKHGYIDEAGSEVVPLIYDANFSYNSGDGRDFIEGMAAVRLDGKWGFIDTTGREIVQLMYDDVRPFSEGIAAVMLDNKWGFVDSTGREIVPPKYDRVNDFTEGMAVVAIGIEKGSNNGQYGFIDKTGGEVIPLIYGRANDFSKDVALVYLDEKGLGIIDKTGNEIVPLEYKADDIRLFYDGVMALKKDKLWGIFTFEYE